MKFLKWTGIIIGSLLVLFLLLGIFMSKEFKVEKKTTVPASAATVYNILNDISLQSKWNPWLMDDKTMNVSYSENTIGKGATYTYTSEEFGNGSEMITNSVPNERVDLEIAFDGGDPAKINYLIAPLKDNSELTWTFSGKMGYPSNVLLPIMKWQIGNSIEKGLANIKKIAETRWKEGKYYDYTITYDQLPERNFVLKRGVVPQKDIQQFYLTNLGGLFQAVQKSGQQMDGMPCGLYFSENKIKKTFDMAAAIPVIEQVEIPNAASLSIPQGKGLIIDHYGDYAGLSIAHLAAETYMRDREMVHHEPIIEEYLSDPTQEEDPSKVLTRIYYYLADTGINGK
jgi:effector-binding domain-containing protein